MDYLTRHWRGELSLPVAFWVNNVLLPIPLGSAIGALMAWASAWGRDLQTFACISLAATLLLVAISFWAPIGAWRSATRSGDKGGSPSLALAAKCLLGLVIAVNLLSVLVGILPGLPEQWRLALGRDPLGSLQIAIAPDGETATLRGPFGMGAARRFRQVADQAPRLRRVVLASPGGRLYEAHEIAEVVRARKLQTRADGDCASACTLVFIAGQRRSLVRPARLGFHRASVASPNPVYDELANHRLAELYGEAGLPPDFIEGVLRTPSRSIWFPTTEVLADAGILPPATLRPEIDAALPADAPPERYAETLADNLLWGELERRKPGVLALAAARLAAARLDGAGPDQAAQAARSVALAAVPDVLRSSGPRMQGAYLSMLAAGIRARQGQREATCQAFATTGEGSPTWIDDWLRDALTEPIEPLLSGRAVSPLELEVLRRELGADAPERIASLLPSPGARRRYHCVQMIELLDQMTRLRGPQRALAVRLMLQAGSAPVS